MKRAHVDRISLLFAAIGLLFVAADWTNFLGPNGANVSDEAAVPTTWSAEENVLWKTALPGAGASSPITLGDKIFVTTYSGYGLDSDNPGEQEKLQHNLVCLDRTSGEIVWAAGVKPKLPKTDYRGFIALHGYASSTPVTDGRAVYAFFGSSGVVSFGIDGKPLWRADVGETVHNWGSATSPLLYENLVIVNASVESKSIVALNKDTGQVVWRASDIIDSWSTPLLVTPPAGRAELVVSMKGKALGLDPASGRQLWECASVNDYVCPAVAAHDGVAYITGGRKPLTMAVKTGGRGDVTNTHVLWTINKCSKVSTPVYYQGHLYWIDNKGLAVCVNAANGDVVYEERLEIEGRGDKVYASPTCVAGKLYNATRVDGTIVLAADPSFEEISRNRLDDSSVFNATAVPDNGRLLLRSDKFIYCIGN